MFKNKENLSEDEIIYIDYRNAGKQLNNKILNFLNYTQKPSNDLKLLKILKGNNVYMFSPEEKDRSYDFIIYEKTLHGKSGLDLYLENIETNDTKELQLIDAMKNASAAIYKVMDLNSEKSTVKLQDLDTDEIIEIIDFGFSNTLNHDCLLFTRILKLEDINFTSGLAMIFNNNHKEFLQRVLKKDIRKSDLDSEVQKFISYFYLSRKHGLNTLHV